jgi:hypothetical protein
LSLIVFVAASCVQYLVTIIWLKRVEIISVLL